MAITYGSDAIKDDATAESGALSQCAVSRGRRSTMAPVHKGAGSRRHYAAKVARVWQGRASRRKTAEVGAAKSAWPQRHRWRWRVATTVPGLRSSSPGRDVWGRRRGDETRAQRLRSIWVGGAAGGRGASRYSSHAGLGPSPVIIIGQSAQRRAGHWVVAVVVIIVIIVVIVSFGHCAGPLYTDALL